MQIRVATPSPGPGTVVTLIGKLDGMSAATVEKALLAVIDGGETKLVIDCAKLDFISSAGLRSLIMAIKRMKVRSGTIAMAGLQRYVKEILDLSGLAPLFRIAATTAEALA
jgi:anti-anti-sigma factor